MHVEECCRALLHYVLPEIDQSRKGLCIDMGVGTFDMEKTPAMNDRKLFGTGWLLDT